MSAAGGGPAQVAAEPGHLVHVGDRCWVVADVMRSGQAPDVLPVLCEPPQCVVHVVSADDNGFRDGLDVVWERNEQARERFIPYVSPADGGRTCSSADDDRMPDTKETR